MLKLINTNFHSLMSCQLLRRHITASVMVLMNGMSMSHCSWHFFFRFWWRTEFLPHGFVSCCCPPTASSSRLLISSTVVLLTVHPTECATVTGSLFSLLLAPTLGVEPAFSVQHDLWSWNTSLWGYPLFSGVLPGTMPWLYHTELLLCHCSPSHRELNVVVFQGSTMALPHSPVVAYGISNPHMHHEHGRHQVPGWTNGRFQW
jgi:hypothetical protein